MATFIPIQYHTKRYPDIIKPTIEEISGHFDVKNIRHTMPYSLHTEYSFAKRNFNSELVKQYPTLIAATQNGIPQLWHSKKWAVEFAGFICALVYGHEAPKIIEVHPPFSDYSDIDSFMDTFCEFESAISDRFPDTALLIENRSGSYYKNGSFILSNTKQLFAFCESLVKHSTHLSIALDIPQLFTAHGINERNQANLVRNLSQLSQIRQYIKGIHLWGKRLNAKGTMQAHYGDLNTYFHGRMEVKKLFLETLYDLLDDDKPRWFVPEVNSANQDLESIVSDLLMHGFKIHA